MSTRVLVTYATRAGSTGEIADTIGKVLQQRGFKVDVRTIRSQPPLENYQAAVIGSAVRNGSWLPEAVDFVVDHEAALGQMPVALFTVHIKNTADDPRSAANREDYLLAVRPWLKPISEIYVAGAIDPAKISKLDRLIARAINAPTGDFRNWDEIREWAGRISLN